MGVKGNSVPPQKKKLPKSGVKPFSKQKSHQSLSLDALRSHFDKPLAEVATYFGVCTTLMKKICRRVGIKRWPYRQIRSVRKSITSMENASCHFGGSQLEAYEAQIKHHRLRLASLLLDPNADFQVNNSSNKFAIVKTESPTSTAAHMTRFFQQNEVATNFHSFPEEQLMQNPALPSISFWLKAIA